MSSFKSLFLVPLLWTGLLLAQPVSAKNDIQTIEKLGKQMSNIRLMLETYALLGMGIPYSHPDKILTQSITEYEGLLDELQHDYPKDTTIQTSVQNSRKAWKGLKHVLTTLKGKDKAALKKDALFFHANIHSIIKEMSADKAYLMHKNKIKHADLLNAAMEVGASARRLSSHYMMKLWKLDDPTIKTHWDQGIAIYEKSLATLKRSSYASDPTFKALLDTSAHALAYFKMLFGTGMGHMPTLVHKKAEKVYTDAMKMSSIIAASIAH